MQEQPRPEQYQPRLRWYSHTWRLLLCLLISTMVWSQAWEGQWQDHRGLFWLDLGAGAAVPTSWSCSGDAGRCPVAIATTALGVVSGVAAGPATLAAVSLATRRRILPVAVVGVVGVVAAQGYSDIQPLATDDPVWFTVLVNVIVTVGDAGLGHVHRLTSRAPLDTA